MSIKILLADDHPLVRAGLRAVLAAEPDLEVVAEAADGRQALTAARQHRPEVVVMDITMPGLNGIEATRQMVHDLGVRVVALSTHGDRQFVAAMLQAGALGYLIKSVAAEDLVAAIRAVAAGRAYLGAQITGVVVSDYLQRLDQIDSADHEELTPREREVLQLIAEGHTTTAIAELLHLSPKTVESHRANVMKKLDLHTVAELTKWAVRRGLTSP